MLILVDLTRRETQFAPRRVGDGHTQLTEAPGPIPAAGLEQLGPDDIGLRMSDRAFEQLLQGIRSDDRIVVQEPQPFVTRRGGRGRRERLGDGHAEAVLAGRRHAEVEDPGILQEVEALIGRSGVDCDESVRTMGELVQGRKGLGQPAGSVVIDEDRGHQEMTDRHLLRFARLSDPVPGLVGNDLR